MRLDQPPRFHRDAEASTASHVVLRAAGGALAHVFALEDDIVRLVVLPDGRWRFPRTWAIAPGLEDLPAEGRDRLDLSGFNLPAFDIDETQDELRLSTACVRLHIALNGLR